MTSKAVAPETPGYRTTSVPLAEVRRLLGASIAPRAPVVLPIAETFGRIAARDVPAERPCPSGDMASIDGWAVASIDTIGAAPVAPVYVFEVHSIAAGAALPSGLDAVLAPHQGRVESGFLVAEAPLAPGENVLRRGGDIATGARLVAEGKTIDAFDIALARHAGISDLAVRSARVVVHAGAEPASRALAECLVALCRRAGAEAVLRDETDAGPADVVVRIGGGIGEDEGPAISPALVGADRIRVTVVDGQPRLHLPDRLDVVALVFETLLAPTLDPLLGRARASLGETRPLARKIASRVGMSEIALLDVTPEGLWLPLAIGELPSSIWARARGVVELAPESEGCPEGVSLTAHPPRFRL